MTPAIDLAAGRDSRRCDSEQAQESLPLWQMLQALQGSNTASQAEVEAVLNQIQEVMTPDQLVTIKEIGLTLADMWAIAQKRGLRRGGGSSGGREGRVSPPDGVDPGRGGSGVPGRTVPSDIGTPLAYPALLHGRLGRETIHVKNNLATTSR